MPDAEIVNMFELNRVLRNSSEVSECVASRSSKEYTISNVNDDNGVPLVYVINYNDNAGFVIVSARSRGSLCLHLAMRVPLTLNGMRKWPLNGCAVWL